MESKGPRICTLEQLIAACAIDLDAWQIERHIINKWEVGVRHPVTGEVIVEPLFQVKAWIVKRKLEPVELVIQPVRCAAARKSLPRSPSGERATKRAVYLCDWQAGFRRDLFTNRLDPFHDRLALDVALQIVEACRPDVIVLGGDILDLPDSTDKFIRSPEYYWNTQPAVIEVHWWLTQLWQAAPKAEIHLEEGNHEKRLGDSVITHLQAVYKLHPATELDAPPALSVPGLLDLEGLGIHWAGGYPNERVWLNDGLACIHGDVARKGSGDTAKVLAQADWSCVFGHIHRREMATRSIHSRFGARTVSAFSPGCLCRVDGSVPGSSDDEQWQQGLAVIDYDERAFTVTLVPIEEGRGVWNGQVFCGRERTEELREDTGWGF